ncbi:MAG TPA: hypothetical protein VNV38_06215 [Stellaceae bacterium]|jgi:hypothetical protein|nr:hypothetical protein [Stellaceae bacterium]
MKRTGGGAASIGPARRGDQTPIKAIIVGRENHRLAPIAALGDMVGQVRHKNARDPGHADASFRRFTRWS